MRVLGQGGRKGRGGGASERGTDRSTVALGSTLQVERRTLGFPDLSTSLLKHGSCTLLVDGESDDGTEGPDCSGGEEGEGGGLHRGTVRSGAARLGR